MTIIKIKNFGPIGENIDENGNPIDNGFFTVDFSKITVFIGPQASGKSTLAKLFSTLSWIDKAFAREAIPNDFRITKEVIKNLCSQQELLEYFHDDTRFVYVSDNYRFDYDETQESLQIKQIGNISKLPKIQYVSAARNLLTILYSIYSSNQSGDRSKDPIAKSTGIPFMVNDLNREYVRSLNALAKDGFDLPIDDINILYNNHTTIVKSKNSAVSMSAASSGIQSITPLLIVSRFLSYDVNTDLFEKLKSVSDDVKNKIENALSQSGDSSLVDKFRLFMMGGRNILDDEKILSKIESASSQYVPSYLIEIIEEPEQNLFPKTQAEVIYNLLECVNSNKNNMIVISTHSPYILTALNNAILAHDVFDATGKYVDEMPENRMISFDNVRAYMLENRKVIPITDNDDRLINAEKIDGCSTAINEMFSNILDLNNE